MKYVTFFLTLILLAGCKSVPAPEETTTVPQMRLWSATKRSDAHLVVIGEASLGGDCTIRISIDGKPAADFVGAEVAHFGLTIGSHSLLLRASAGCSKIRTQEAKISVKAGDALIMRIDKAGRIRTEL